MEEHVKTEVVVDVKANKRGKYVKRALMKLVKRTSELLHERKREKG